MNGRFRINLPGAWKIITLGYKETREKQKLETVWLVYHLPHLGFFFLISLVTLYMLALYVDSGQFAYTT